MEEDLDNFDRVKRFFELFGYEVLSKPTIQDNDVHMYVVGNKRALRSVINKQQLIEKIEALIDEETMYITDVVSGWDVPKAETARETLIEVLKLVKELE